MSTRAEEIAAEGPYSKFGDPKIGRWYVLCDPDPYCWELDERKIDARVMALNTAFIKGYKQGQQHRWISVSERLPDPNVEVLVAFENDTVAGTSQRTRVKSPDIMGWLLSAENGGKTITHWMPLPSPPDLEHGMQLQKAYKRKLKQRPKP